jgi:plastocyanin
MFKRSISTQIAATVVAASLIGLGSTHAGPGADPATRPAEFKVVIDNFTFSPQTLKVPQGATITWVNRDDVPHTVTSNSGVFDSKTMDTDQTFTQVLKSPGTFPYYCAVHPHMTGTIVVEPAK